jgi:hypothetical protein
VSAALLESEHCVSFLTRRQFLLLGRDLYFLLAALPGVSFAKDRLGARGAKILNAEQRHVLFALAVTLFKNEGDADELYQDAVLAIDAECAENARTKQVVLSGIERLGNSFPQMHAAQRVQMLKSREGSQFFRLVYAAMLRHVHGDRRTWLVVRPQLAPV